MLENENKEVIDNKSCWITSKVKSKSNKRSENSLFPNIHDSFFKTHNFKETKTPNILNANAILNNEFDDFEVSEKRFPSKLNSKAENSQFWI